MGQLARTSLAPAQYGRPRLTKLQLLLSCHSQIMLINLGFSLLGLVLTTMICESFARKKNFKFRVEAAVAGKLKTRLSALPYSEVEYNKQFKTAFPSQKQKVARFSKKASNSNSLINYCDGLRRTSFVPLNKKIASRIYLFGGSTIDCQEVPDDYTIASRLQAKINDSGLQETYEVINCGVIGATLAANLIHFKELPKSKSDICIFYFGVNETNFQNENIYISRFLIFSFIDFNRLYRFATVLNFVILKSLINKFRTFDKNNNYFREKQDQVDQIFSEINSICIENSVTLLTILQPFLHTRSPVSQFDKGNLRYHKGPAFDASKYLYEQFVKKFDNRNYFIDGRSLFNNVELDVFTDWCHCNYLGNDIIADYFFSLVQKNT